MVPELGILDDGMTVKRLFLLRHAKSAWDDPERTDFERPLAPRGRRAAKTMGAFMRDGGYRFDQVLCSAAKRARQTWRRVADELGHDAARAVTHDKEIYLAGAPALLNRLRRTDDAVETLVVVGHNPDMEHLANTLCADGEQGAVARIREKYPTGALAEIDLNIGSWTELAANCGTLVRFTRPRDLD